MAFFQIDNSVALVTGTNRKNGIGRGIVQALLQNGAKKVYATARDASQLDDLVAATDDRVVPISLDMTDLDAIKSLPEKCPDVNLIVNNAGYAGYVSSLDDVSRAQTEIAVNYIAPLAIVQSFADILQKQKSTDFTVKATAIVNIGSVAGWVNIPGIGTYSASKSAARSLTEAQRRDLKDSLVVGVYPGPIDTSMAENFPMDKAPVSVVADAVVDALQNGTEDVFPDPTATEFFEGWKADAKEMERKMAQPDALSQ